MRGGELGRAVGIIARVDQHGYKVVGAPVDMCAHDADAIEPAIAVQIGRPHQEVTVDRVGEVRSERWV